MRLFPVLNVAHENKLLMNVGVTDAKKSMLDFLTLGIETF